MSETVLLERLQRYVEKFNSEDNEIHKTYIPNDSAFNWMASRVPLVDIPDRELESVYYFRWWTFRKHIRKTENGYIISEFLPSVPWAGRHNSIAAASAHHIKEGRWLRNEKAIDSYIRYWYQESDNFNDYSHWFEHSLFELCLQRRDFSIAIENLDSMIRWYEKRERTNFKEAVGLFWSSCDRDAMEFAISGDGFRLPLNTYMCANAGAISEFARVAGRTAEAEDFMEKSRELSGNIEKYLWDENRHFYMCLNYRCGDENAVFDRKDDRFVVRELWGYLPWYFNLAPDGREGAFSQLHDAQGFFAPFGLTTAEQRHPGFGCFYTGEELNEWLLFHGLKSVGPKGHECLWNGPVWPFASSMALTALANSKRPDDGLFYKLLKQYADSHRMQPGSRSPYWIDEVMHPRTGDWISRTRLKEWSDSKGWDTGKGGKERGKDYNHSTFCDLVISGLFGVTVGNDGLKARPRFPADWENAALYHVPFAGKLYTVRYAKSKVSVTEEPAA